MLVRCYSGNEYADRPLSFYWEGTWREVEMILAQWRLPQGKLFQVRDIQKRLFQLRYDQIREDWEINPLG
ncbi:MAG: hypothetical protein J7555_02410 [Chloroflexi bacterium]|jgi:hypothetical protein|nr:hypothetical protein [Chloroflexota bacterium]